jgi:AcrR family transcriptional regulator
MSEGGAAWGDVLLPQMARLPSGRHGLPREFVAANHRERLIAACAQEVLKRGYSETTVAHVIKTAAVSRRSFYESFESKEECFLATYDLLFDHLSARVVEAFTSQHEWPEQLRAALQAMLGFLAEQPGIARLCMVEPLVAGPPISDHHRAAVDRFAPLFRAGRDPERPDEPPVGTEEAVAFGIAQLIMRRIVSGDVGQLEEMCPDLLETALTPFTGPVEAERIAGRPV